MVKREIIAWVSCTILVLLLIYIILLEMWGLKLFGYRIDYNRFGTWGQMVSAIGTTSAFLIGLTNLVYQKHVFDKLEERRLKDEKTKVALWLTHNIIEDEWVSELLILNSTILPIYHWVVQFENITEHICSIEKRPLIPGENLFKLNFLDGREPSKCPAVTLLFEDKSNGFWSQSSKGLLKPIKEKEISCIHNQLILGGTSIV